MRLIAFFFRLSPFRMTAAMAAGVLSGLMSVIFIAALTTAMRGQMAFGGAWIFVGLWAGMLCARLVSEWVLLHLSQRQVHHLRLTLCREIIRVPQRDLETMGSHSLVTHLTEDVNAISHAGTSIPSFCMSVTIVTACLIYCMILAPIVFAAVFTVMILGIAAHRVIGTAATAHMEQVRECQDVLMRQYRTLINGSKEIKLNSGRRSRLLAGLETTTRAMRAHVVDASRRYALAGTLSQTMYFLVIAGLLFPFPLWAGMRRDVLVGAILAVFAMRGSVEVIVGFAPGLMRAQLSLKKLERLGVTLHTLTAAESSPSAAQPLTFERLELVDLSFAYQADDGSSFVLGPLNLAMRRGEMVFISGGNGTGKTTLAKLLTGLYLPDAGRILVDGEPVGDHNRQRYRETFAAVFSDFHLYDDLPDPLGAETEWRAREFLVTLRLDSKVRIENGRLSTTALSQGQRKRLALLMAYLEDRPAYLFDEWAADQDSSFRRLFYEEILADLKARGKTLCVITHDEQYYGLADRVIYLQDGVVHREQYADALRVPLPSPRAATVSTLIS